MDLNKIKKYSTESLVNEIFFEENFQESIILRGGQLETNSKKIEGFGARCFADKIYFYSNDRINDESINNCNQYMEKCNFRKKTEIICDEIKIDNSLYPEHLELISVQERINLIKEIDAYLMSKHNKIKIVNVIIRTTEQKVFIYNGNFIYDSRPLIALIMEVIVEDKHIDKVYMSWSQRNTFNTIYNVWKNLANELLRKIDIVLKAQQFEGGNLPVVLGCGVPATLLHEAVGHGLEGDFNRKDISVYSNQINEIVANKNVTVIDDGRVPNARGSIAFDDEGYASKKNILIENGILKSYMCDKISGEILNIKHSNGRRQDFSHMPMPRMTNTYMLGGEHTLNEIIESVNYGIYATDFNRGQVDITSGQFAFSGTEVYLIENGKLKEPLRGCTISGLGQNVIKNITMVGKEFALDECGGTCGKNGQWVPVGLGQPPILVENLTVGAS